MKLNPLRENIAGQRLVVIDDSIVRGTTSRKIVQLCRDAGAERSTCGSPVRRPIGPCYYGIDTPNADELIASKHNVEEIREHIGADSLGFLSLEGMMKAARQKDGEVCTACWTKDHPVPLPPGRFGAARAVRARRTRREGCGRQPGGWRPIVEGA